MSGPYFTTDANDLLTTLVRSRDVMDQIHAIVEQAQPNQAAREQAIRSAVCSLFGSTGAKAWHIADMLNEAYLQSLNNEGDYK